ncbi:PQQ enzyme repeat domain protein [Halorubrum lipolyticum DSM 21995]|uniref:PQQ enzyme repeat domain protein n=2 Tax=Halorubrum lipolyticum TaxID=368624 RepID=M0NNZ3_9EURY|nr:PQQ-binding-like beta-propeller repeat protein [Halorubrum lipolyticum]EMA59662.1 PQQ enzyme repeat domain protein [Halorubrum lipolyticum DSM 21995]
MNSDRRSFLAAASTASFGLLGGCVGPRGDDSGSHPVSEPVTEWPSFRGDRYNTGFARGVSPTSADPSVEWTYDADGPFWGSPVVADGAVFVGNADGTVYAFDAATGEERWTFATDNRIEGSPAYADGTVYVGSYDTRVYAIDADSGEATWRRDLGGLIRGSPTVVGETAYIGVGCHNLACAVYAEESDAPSATDDGWVYALDTVTGETDWRYGVGDEVVSTPAVDDDTVYVGASDDTFYALDAGSGEEVWTYDVGDMVWSSPTLAFDTVYFGDWNGIVHAVDAASGEAEWTADPFARYISGSVAVDDSGVYVGDTPYNTLDDPNTHYGEMHKFDRRSGEELWSFETDALEVGSSPVVTDDRLYFGTHGQTDRDGLGVYGLTTDGDEAWFIEVGGRGVGSSPALVDGTLYVSGTDGRMYAIE